VKVLWYAPAPLPAVTGSLSAGGGWIEGLRRALEQYAPEIELGIAVPSQTDEPPLTTGNATYFSVPHPLPGNRIDALARRWRHAQAPPGAVERCAQIAHTYAPDLLHFHGTEHYYGLVASMVARPAVISLQGIATAYERFALREYTGRELLAEALSREFRHGHGPLHGYWSLRARAARERRIIESCDDFLGRTEWDRTVIRLLRPAARYHEVGEVLGEPFYGPVWHGSEASEDTLYCTAGASARKGVEVLLEALMLVRRAGVCRWRLRLAGGVMEGEAAGRVEALLGAPELRGAVDVLGGCAPAQIATELSRASAFVLPSHIDNSPNALCEAMLVGVPCIAAFVGGVPSLITDGVDGLLYHDADPYALAGKIDRLLGDRPLAERLGANARKRALERHDPARVAAQAVEAYREVLRRWHEHETKGGPSSVTPSSRAGEAGG